MIIEVKNKGGKSPSQMIEEARLTLAIASEAEEQALSNVVDIIERAMSQPRTCKHPGAKLSATKSAINDALDEVLRQVQALRLNALPF